MKPLPSRRPAPPALRRLDAPVAVLLAALLGWLYLQAPVVQMADSRYTLLASHAALHHQTLLLDRYNLPFTVTAAPHGQLERHYPYQLDQAGEHVVSHYPPGTPLLSAPLLAWRESAGETVLTPTGQYAPWLDERIQHELAALLTAVTVLLLWALARTWLPPPWSWLVAGVAGVASPLLSTTSRALWSHTWGVLVLTVLLLHLRRLALAKPVSPVLLGTLGAWLYLIRPSFSLAVAATGLLLLDHARRAAPELAWPRLFLRPLPLRFGLTVLAWLAPFGAWARSVWGGLPPYYRHPLGNPEFFQALAGNLVSPQRGVLLYCAWLLPTAWLLLRYRRALPQPRLAVAALGYLAVHWLLISLNPMWTGGGSYGPRLMTDLVPVLVLLLAQGLAAWRATAPQLGLLVPASLAVTVALSAALHIDGAWNTETWRWHTWPHAGTESARMWDWEHAEFRAGLDQPMQAYTPGTTLGFSEHDPIVPYLLRGWANPERDGCWTMAPLASLQLAMPPVAQPRLLELTLAPFQGRPPAPQPVAVQINGVAVGRWVVDHRGTYALSVPAELAAAAEWRIDLRPEQPGRPDVLGLSADSRLLGVYVASLRIR